MMNLLQKENIWNFVESPWDKFTTAVEREIGSKALNAVDLSIKDTISRSIH